MCTCARTCPRKQRASEFWNNIPGTFLHICHSSLYRCELFRAEQLQCPLAHLARQQKSNWLIDGNLFFVWSRNRRETQIHTQNFQFLPKCSPAFSEASTVSLKNHRKQASERDGDKPELSLRAIDCVGVIFSASWLRLEYHPPDPLTGRCNSVAAAVGVTARPECGAVGALWARQGDAGELRSQVIISKSCSMRWTSLAVWRQTLVWCCSRFIRDEVDHLCCCCTSLSCSSRKHSLLITIAPRRASLSACRSLCSLPAISDSFHQYLMFLHWLSCPLHPDFMPLRSHGAKSALCFITHGTLSNCKLWQVKPPSALAKVLISLSVWEEGRWRPGRINTKYHPWMVSRLLQQPRRQPFTSS